MGNSIERLKQLKQLLTIEQEEDYLQYKEQFLKASIEQRKKNGLTWFPIQILSEELGYADYMHIEIERTSQLDTPHQFSSGKNVTLFSNKDPNEIQEITGTIKQSNKNKLKIILHTDELPEWCYEGRLGVNIQFDDNSYIEMQKALDEVINARNNRVAEIREIIEGDEVASFEKKDETIVIPQLNVSQNIAVQHILSSNDIAIVHGPPGTGKTTTIVQAIRLVLQTENQVLVCAPTNTAVDLITEKLKEQGINVLRLGHPARVSEDLLKSTIDGQIQQHVHYKDIKNLRKNAEEYFKMASKYKRVFGKEEQKQRAMYYSEAKNCIKESRLLEDYIIKSLFESSQVICCTPVASTHKALTNKKFRTVFFDEASQALEPMSWIPILKSHRIIFSGDHFQLPPVVKNTKAKQNGLDKTILDRCTPFNGVSVLLNRQYRMHERIMHFSNSIFYNNKLEADVSVKNTTLSLNEDFEILNNPVELIDTAGCSYDEMLNPETLSICNEGEAQLLFNHLAILLQQYEAANEKNKISIGIISPYKEQISLLKEKLNSLDYQFDAVNELEIKTIDGFQGEEMDVIYISLVRSNPDSEIGFLSDIRRMNVALTRARKKLIVIMDTATIGNHPFYKAFIDYCESINSYKSAWEYQYNA